MLHASKSIPYREKVNQMIFSTDRSRLRSEYFGSFFEINHSLMMNTMQMILETIVQGYAGIEIIPGPSLIWSNVASMFIECGNVMSIVSSSLGSLAHRMLSIVTKNILLTAGTVCKTPQNPADTSLTTNITNTDVGVLTPLPLRLLPSYVPSHLSILLQTLTDTAPYPTVLIVIL